MRRTVLAVHHIGRRLNIVTGLPWDRVIVFGIRWHGQTMVSGAVQRSVMSLIGGKLAGMIDGMLRLILLAVMGGSGAQSARGSEVVIFVRGARRAGRAPTSGK